MTERIRQAKRWKRDGEVRFYIETVDEGGKAHYYTRYLTGNYFQPKRSWGTQKLWNGQEEGEPNAEIVAEYKRLTENGRKSYYAPKPVQDRDHIDNVENDVREPARSDYIDRNTMSMEEDGHV